MALRTLTVLALVAAVAAASATVSKSDQLQQAWAKRIQDSTTSLKNAEAVVVKGLTGEKLSGVQRAVDWLNKYTFPKMIADLTNFAGLLRLESLQIEKSSRSAAGQSLLAAWPRNMTEMHKSNMDNLKTTVDALTVRISGESSGPMIHPVRVALSAASATFIKTLQGEQQADVALLNQQMKMFN